MRFRRTAPSAALALLATGCAWMPEPATEEAQLIVELWEPYTIVAGVVAALILGLLLKVLVLDRRRGDEEQLPSQTAYSIPLEITYLLIPLAVLGWLAVGALRTGAAVEAVDADPDVTIEVVAYRWQWQFTYAGEDVVVDGAEQLPELVLPAPAVVEFTGTSQDVVHSLWVPDFLFKRDMVPGRTTTFQVTTTEPGEHFGACAEYCGLDHSQMTFRVRTVPPDEFDTWLDEQREATP